MMFCGQNKTIIVALHRLHFTPDAVGSPEVT